MPRKKTARQSGAHRVSQRATKESELIVTAKSARRSVGSAHAVDNRSHRTPSSVLAHRTSAPHVGPSVCS